MSTLEVMIFVIGLLFMMGIIPTALAYLIIWWSNACDEASNAGAHVRTEDRHNHNP